MATTGLTKLLAASLALAALSTGCAIHSQGPVREIAYDFSDADFYNRAYAPSPHYASDHSQYRMVDDRAMGSATTVETEAAEADVETIDVLDHVAE